MNPLLELRGQPGQAFGSFLAPSSGKTLFKLQGNRLIIETKLSLDLEIKRTVIRVKEIGTVQLNEGPYWILLILGIFLSLPLLNFSPVGLIGIAILILFFFLKQRSFLVYANGLVHVVFYKDRDQELAENFALSLLQVADQ